MRKTYSVQLEPQIHKQVKSTAFFKEIKISDIVENACKVYLKLLVEAEKHGKTVDELVKEVQCI